MDTVRESIKMAHFGQKWALKRYIKAVENDLRPREELLAMAAPIDKPDDILFVTNERVINYNINSPFDVVVETIPISMLRSYFKKTKAVYANLEFHSSKQYIEVKKVPISVANEIYNILKNLVN
jgi:hypothetical protein